MGDDASQALLEARLLEGGGMDGIVVEVHDVAVEPYLQHRLLPGEEAAFHPFLHHGAVEADPEFLPAGGRVGPVGVPFAGKE